MDGCSRSSGFIMSAKPAILDHAATLADVTRCRVLQLLDGHELTVSELYQVLQIPQSTVSRHLKVLSEDGWLRSRRDGTSRLYQMATGDNGNGLSGGAAALWQLISGQIAETPVSGQDQARLQGILTARRGRSQEFFASALEWDRLRDELFGSRFDLLALVGLLDPSWVIGDLGCGTGRLSEALAPFVQEVVAVDGSAAMLEAARERLQKCENVRLHGADLEALPIEDAALDAATLVLALHHVSEPQGVLVEARRALKPGGRLLVVDMLPHDREEYRREMGHTWLGFAADQIRRDLEASGFTGCRIRTLPADPAALGPALFVATAAA
jgi:SAM-dependent methyltransferase/DNA-binding transcriptional ArsR family regulator